MTMLMEGFWSPFFRSKQMAQILLKGTVGQQRIRINQYVGTVCEVLFKYCIHFCWGGNSDNFLKDFYPWKEVESWEVHRSCFYSLDSICQQNKYVCNLLIFSLYGFGSKFQMNLILSFKFLMVKTNMVQVCESSTIHQIPFNQSHVYHLG